ncbi:MAG TPA: polymer-forming cytoskeletal protein [Symbiobacteriaceae bacterium]|nr:polymer-forming cytoskeletal protein [Symbiobacteriaceae bacterium]
MPKFLIVFVISLVSLFAVPAPAMAMDWRQSDRAVVGRDEVINDDMLLTGTNVVVEGTINGDLLAFGGSIIINGTVNGNLITAGDRIEIKGTVTGSVYGAATDINISGRIERTLAAGGPSVTLDSGAYVGHSGLLCGDLIQVNGKIGRGALLGGNRVDVGGQIGRELRAYVDALNIGSGAVVEGPIDYYTSGRRATVAQDARIGAVEVHQIAPTVTNTWRIVWKVARLLGFLLVGLSVLALFPGLRRRYPKIVMQRPWRAPAVGLAALILVPISSVLMLFTLVGIPLSLVTLALFPALIYLSQVLVSWTAGKLLADRVERFRNLSWPVIFLMGAILTSAVVAVPGVGCLFGFIALLYGLGGLYSLLIQRAA